MFQRFWPVYKQESVSVQQLIETATSLFSKIYGKSPVSAYFEVQEEPDSRIDRETYLNMKVMPWHLSPESESNSDKDPTDQDDIVIRLDGKGDVTQCNDNPRIPFTIRYVFHDCISNNVCLCNCVIIDYSSINNAISVQWINDDYLT